MKRIFYSMALALCALMVSIPAKAGNVYNAATLNELFQLLGYGQTLSAERIQQDDTIRITADITYSTGVTDNRYLFIPANTTRTLDLNGKTVLNKPAIVSALDANMIEMCNNSTLNICDTKGGGRLVNNSQANFVGDHIFNSGDASFQYDTYYINSACIVNEKRGSNPAAKNCTVNVYGGSIIAWTFGRETDQSSSIFCRPDKVLAEGQPSLLYANGGYLSNPNMTVNIYGGCVGTIRSYKYTFKTYEEDYQTVQEARSYWQDADSHLHFSYKDYYSNPLTVNLYGGSIGYHNFEGLPALCYPKGFSGTLKDGTIYGIASEDHLNNFNGVADGVKVYLNGTQTTVNALKTQDLADKTVRFAYEPDLSVSGIAVTKDNCTDIMPWEEFKASFDYATNTLYLKTLSNPTNVLNGIQFADFDLRIVVDGYWRINGSIVGTNGDLTITSNHFALAEEDGDALVMKPGDNTAITLDGHRLTLTNRVRLLCYNNESGHTAQSAVKCHDMWVNNSWFDAWGKKPIVDCAYGSVVNATIKTGSFKNNDVIQVEPQFTQYYIFVQTNGDERGSVTGEGIYNEGTELTISATPKSGYYFDRWYEDGSTDATRTITVTKDATFTALFFPEEVINYYDVTVLSADETMGTVSGGGTHIEQGQTVTITATPNEGYQFLYWTTADGQVQGAISQWTVTKDETLIAHFRVAPPADAVSLWVCGTQVTGSNSADILGDGVWCYDHETRTLTVMKDATYNITNDGFIEDWAGSGTDEPLIVNVGNHKVEAICTTTDNTLRNAIVGTKGMTFSGTTYHGVTLTAQNMYAANFSKPLTVTGHMDLTLNLKNTTDWGKDNFKTAVLLAGVTPSLIVDGANLYINSGVGESAGSGYKATNKTDQAANLSMNNASIQWGSISSQDLGILDDSPKYEINYLTPALESLCLTSAFGLSFFEGTHFNLYAYPAPGYKFVSWSDGNTDNPRLIIMPAHNVYLDPIVEVDDSQTPKGAIINASATEGQGTITNFTSGWYAEGTELTITAEPAEGYEFVEWSDGETANPYLLTVENGKNINITAMFCGKGQGIENIQVEGDQPQKIMMDGILYIVRDGKIYNALGAEVK